MITLPEQYSSILNEGSVRYRARVTKYSITWPSTEAPWWTSTPTLDSSVILRMGKQGRDSSWSIQRSRDQLAATCTIEIANDPQGTYSTTVQPMDLLRFQVKIWGASTPGRLIDIGWFFVDDVDIQKDAVVINCRDAVKLGLLTPYEGTLAGDRIQEPLQDPGVTEYVVLQKIELANYYVFVDGDGTTDEEKMLSRTVNWTANPMAEILRSADTNATKSADDELLDVNSDAVKILWGLGQVRIDKQLYDSEYSSKPYLKARYWRFANYTDAIRGSVTAVSTDTITDTFQTVTIDRYIDCHVRFLTGAQRFRAFKVTDNDGTMTLTLDTDVEALGVGVGDRYELVDFNDARWRMIDLALESEFQSTMSSRPFFIRRADRLLLDKDPIRVTKEVAAASTSTDITADMTDEELQFPTSPTTATVLEAVGDSLVIGSEKKFSNIYIRLSNTPSRDFDVKWEYWGSAGPGWASLRGCNVIDRTNGLKQSGIVSFNIPRTSSEWALDEYGSSGSLTVLIASGVATLSSGSATVTHGLAAAPTLVLTSWLSKEAVTRYHQTVYSRSTINDPDVIVDNGDGTFSVSKTYPQSSSQSFRWWAIQAMSGYVATGTVTLDANGAYTGISHGLGAVPVALYLTAPGYTNRYEKEQPGLTDYWMYAEDNEDGTFDIQGTSTYGGGQTVRWWALRSLPGAIALNSESVLYDRMSNYYSGRPVYLTHHLGRCDATAIVAAPNTRRFYQRSTLSSSWSSGDVGGQEVIDYQDGRFGYWDGITPAYSHTVQQTLPWHETVNYAAIRTNTSSSDAPHAYFVRAVCGDGVTGALSETDVLIQSGTVTTGSSGINLGKATVSFPTAYNSGTTLYRDMPAVVVAIYDSSTSPAKPCTVRIEGISQAGFRVATFEGEDLASKTVHWIACAMKDTPNDTFVEAGEVTTDANGTATITFPTAFSDTPSVVPTLVSQAGDPYGDLWVKVRSVSSTQAVIDTYAGTTPTSLKVNWVAKGTATGTAPALRWGTAFSATEGGERGVATGCFDKTFSATPYVASTPYETQETVEEAPLVHAVEAQATTHAQMKAVANGELVPVDFCYFAVLPGGTLSSVSAPSTAPQISTVRLKDAITAKQPLTYHEYDGKKPFDIVEQEYRPALPANYVFRVSEGGSLELREVVQDPVQRYTLKTHTSVSKHTTDGDIYTRVLMRGQANELMDYAKKSLGAIITDEASSYTSSDSSNENANAIDVLIDGADTQTLTLSSGRFQSGYRWVGTVATPIPVNTDLLKIDLLAQANNVEQVSFSLYADNLTVLPEMDILVSSDDITYQKLCDRTKPFKFADIDKFVSYGTWAYEHASVAEYSSPVTKLNGYYQVDFLYSQESNMIQQFRYIKFVHISPATGAVTYPYFIEIYVKAPGIIDGVAELGGTPPFDTAEYEALRNRYRRRTYIVPGVDFSAENVEQLDKRALLFLRELVRNLSAYTINGVRPDARLYDTVALTVKHASLADDDILIERLTLQPLGKITAEGRSYR